MTPQPRKNLANELAKERNREAAERTQLAWVRTCLSMIGFGFGLDNIVSAIARSQMGAELNPMRATHILGLSLAILGTYGMLAATFQHYKILKRIQQDDFSYKPEHPSSLILSVGLMLIGLFAVFSLLVKSSIS